LRSEASAARRSAIAGATITADAGRRQLRAYLRLARNTMAPGGGLERGHVRNLHRPIAVERAPTRKASSARVIGTDRTMS
jgi:hypothetical protein